MIKSKKQTLTDSVFGSLAPSLSEIALDGVGAVAVAGGVAIRQTQESACSQETAGQHEESRGVSGWPFRTAFQHHRTVVARRKKRSEENSEHAILQPVFCLSGCQSTAFVRLCAAEI